MWLSFMFTDTCEAFDDTMFPMPDMMPHGRGGRGCGRGRGMDRGCPRMGRGGMGRPDPRWMTFGGPHGRPDPRQTIFGHWGQRHGGFEGFAHHSHIPWQGPQNMCVSPNMPWAGHLGMGWPVRMPLGRPCGGRGCGRPLNAWRFCYAENAREDKMGNKESSGTCSDSDSDQPEDATNEEKTCDSQKTKVPKKECRRTWRRFMRRQMRGCPRHAFYGGGPSQAWLPPWISSVHGCPVPGRPMVPPPMLHRLRRLLTAMEAETCHQTENSKDQENKTSDEQNSKTTNSTHRQARLQARLRRLIDQIEHQGEDEFPFLPPNPGMLHMRFGPGCWMMPCRRRRMFRHMRRSHRRHGERSDGNRSEEETNEPEDITKDTEDTAMTTTNPGPLEDWQNLRQDVEDLETEEGVPLVDVSEACPTCSCSATV